MCSHAVSNQGNVHWPEAHIVHGYTLQAKAEQDLYLRQLEREGRSQEACRKGSQLVLPEVGFVAKTANKQSGQKIFINVCTSDKVGGFISCCPWEPSQVVQLCMHHL